jgi:tRNA(Arg) A34 adenosine deaminase TadA
MAISMSFPPSPHMARALALARAAADLGEVPVGAVVTAADGTVLASAHNRTRTDRDPTAHAELLAIREAARGLGTERLVGATLWVTLEPCAMCAGAISHARLARLVYAASDPKGGGVEHGARVFAQPTCHHRPEVVAGLGEAEAGILLKDFFAARRT